MQTIQDIIESIPHLKFNVRSRYILENGQSITMKIGFDGLTIQVQTDHTPKTLCLKYSIDTTPYDTDGSDCILRLRSIDTGCKFHITNNSKLKIIDNTIKALTETNESMLVLLDFIKIIDLNVPSIQSDITSLLDQY